MKTRINLIRIMVMVALLGLTAASWPTSAQDGLPDRHALELKFSAAPTEPPTVEETGNTGVFKINPVGKVSGDLEGNLSQRITQVDPTAISLANPVNYLLDIATFFTIETANGKIEGYYYGSFSFPKETYPDAVVRQHGLVLSVTAAYVDLYLADVYYDGVVNFEEVNGNMVGVGDSGTLTIAPR